MILAGSLAAGERLNEAALATSLGVSRGPVREAVRGLERSGLVVAVRNQGSYVRQVSAEEALEIYDIRAALTGLACAQLAEIGTAAQLAALRAMVKRMEVAWRADEAASYYAGNLDFHAALLEFGGGPRARRLYAELGNELHLYRRRALVQQSGQPLAQGLIRRFSGGHPMHMAGAQRRDGRLHLLQARQQGGSTEVGQGRPPFEGAQMKDR